ncbi:MAG: O-antigen ligase family protein [Spirochaetes bacterium]|nr:O-antigen ligase family protein [Spirochaetota bacterium]
MTAVTIKSKMDSLADQMDKVIRFFLIIFVVGSPFSISLAQIGLVPAIIIWLFKVIFLKKLRFYGTFLDTAILLYILGTLLTSFFCEHSSKAFSSIQEIWHILMLYVLIDVSDEKFIKKLIKILFLFTVLTSIYGVWQHFSGWDLIRKRSLTPNAPGASFYNITGGFGLHLTYGGYVMMIALVGLSLILAHRRSDRKYFWYSIAGTFLITFTVYGSYARSAWAGFIVGLLLWGFLKSKKWFAVIMIFLIFFGSVAFFTVPTFKYKIKTFTQIQESRRWQIWSVALKMIKDHPVIGVGHGNFNTYYVNYMDKKNWREPSGHPHNDFLSIYLSTGLIGFISYLLLWFLIIKKGIASIRKTEDEGSNYITGLLSGIVAFMVAGLSQNYFTDSENSMLLWFFISALAVLYYRNTPKRTVQDKIKGLFKAK